MSLCRSGHVQFDMVDPRFVEEATFWGVGPGPN